MQKISKTQNGAKVKETRTSDTPVWTKHHLYASVRAKQQPDTSVRAKQHPNISVRTKQAKQPTMKRSENMSNNIQVNNQTKKDNLLVGDVIKTSVKRQKEIHKKSPVIESDSDDSHKDG